MNRQMVAHIVCGAPDLWLPSDLTGYIVGVDRGALKLIERDVDFHVAIGDFDSVSELERQLIKDNVELLLELPADKDLTDCDAAVDYVVGQGYQQIYLHGTTGGRFDHQFAVIGLMLKYAKLGVQIYVIDEQNKMTILVSGMHRIEMDVAKKYISFFAVEGTVENLTLQDVKYPLKDYDLTVDSSLCVSNEPLSSSVNVSFDLGYLLVVQSSD